MEDADVDEAAEIAHNALFANRSFQYIYSFFKHFIFIHSVFS